MFWSSSLHVPCLLHFMQDHSVHCVLFQFCLRIGQCREGTVFSICMEDSMPHGTLWLITEIMFHHLCSWNNHLIRSVLTLQGIERKQSMRKSTIIYKILMKFWYISSVSLCRLHPTGFLNNHHMMIRSSSVWDKDLCNYQYQRSSCSPNFTGHAKFDAEVIKLLP